MELAQVIALMLEVASFNGERASDKLVSRIKDVAPIVLRESEKKHIDPLLTSAVLWHESSYRKDLVGKHHEVKGQSIAAFVTLKEGIEASDLVADELKEHVVEKIGAIARPEAILFTADLPKTRSGKIMRRLLKDIAEGRAVGDTTTLADPAVVAALKDRYESEGKV